MIPKIIHQIWHEIGNAGAIPPQWMALAQTWKRHHPDWDYRLWTDADSRRFMTTHYPELLRAYDSCIYPIQRVDMLRYCLLHHFGGVYVDMDVECLRPIDGLIDGRAMVISLEPPIHAAWLGVDSLISNAFVAARPGHGLLEDILANLAASPRTAKALRFPRDVFASTGPLMLTTRYERRSWPDVFVMDHHVVSPWAAGAPQLLSVIAGDDQALSYRIGCLVKGVHAIHYWAHAWSPSRQELINPTPYDVPGFVFFQGYDSGGFDIRQGGRNVPELARVCADCAVAIAFNTDGFVKSRLRPRWRWERSPDKAANEGLYVKRSVVARPLWSVLGAGEVPLGS